MMGMNWNRLTYNDHYLESAMLKPWLRVQW